MIRGIGPVYARKMVKVFGEKVFDIIEAEPDRLREVDGIGPVRARRITSAWAEQKIVREIMVFLHSHGVGTARSVRIFKTYGVDAIQVMTENPVSACGLCRWSERCAEQWDREDSLALVAGISRSQRQKLEVAGVTTMAGLATRDERVPRMAAGTQRRLVSQARLQSASLGRAAGLRIARHRTRQGFRASACAR
jgi:predicted flap endonuclease-1-like 5' DNA nuclease